MRILLTNDDGIHADGLKCLERIARTFSDDVWVVGPETDQSGFAHSLSLSEPLRVRRIDDRHYAVRGTPTDCVIMGVKTILPGRPDLILSGVNSGSNVADDVTYSGTIAAAMEGTLLGIRSIAFSQAYRRTDDLSRALPWETAEAHAPRVIERLMGLTLPRGVLINVNFPACDPDQVDGVEVTEQAKVGYAISVDERQDGRGFPYYWLRYGREAGEFAEGTDLHALGAKRISVTPLKLDLTAHELRGDLEKVLA
jgi:5'-nucleotidase